MKILFITREFPYPADSGVKQRNWHILASLAGSHEMHLVCYGRDDQARDPAVRSVCRTVSVLPELPPAGGRSRPARILLGLFSKKPFAIRSRFSPAFRAKVKDLVESQTFDLIVCDSLYQAQNIPETSVPKILNEHNIESVIIRRFAQVAGNPLHRAYAVYETFRMFEYEDRIWDAFDQIWMCSDIDRKEVLARLPNARVEVIPNGVTLDHANLDPSSELPGTLVYTGLIGWHPNEDAVLYFAREIYPLIREKVPQVKWTVAGKGPAPKVTALAENDLSITVTGAVPEITPFVAQAAVVIVPLRIGSGTRLKILEAMAMGKAVVSTTVGCEGLDVTDGENIFIADHPRVFAERVAVLLNDEALRRKLGNNGRRLVEERYSWDVVGKKIGEVLTSVDFLEAPHVR